MIDFDAVDFTDCSSHFRLHKDELLEFNSHWLTFIENTFNHSGLSNVWLEQCKG